MLDDNDEFSNPLRDALERGAVLYGITIERMTEIYSESDVEIGQIWKNLGFTVLTAGSMAEYVNEVDKLIYRKYGLTKDARRQ